MQAADFDAFYHASSRRLMRFAYAMCGDLSEAQDLTQEAYARCWQRWEQIGHYPHPESWLHTVITHLVTDRWRALGVRRQSLAFAGGIAVAAVAATVFVALPSTSPSVDSSPSVGASPSAEPSPSAVASHPASPSSSPSRSPGADCSASDLDSHAYFRGDGAAGTLSYEITIRNGSRRCRLGVPKLEGVNVYTGVREPVAFTPSPGQGRTLAPRAYAEVSVRYGSNPFQPNGSPCVRPPDYKNVALVFPDGSRYALPRVRLTAHCHGFFGAGWIDSQYPQQPRAYQPAAP